MYGVYSTAEQPELIWRPLQEDYTHKHLEDSYRKQAVNCPRKAQEALKRLTDTWSHRIRACETNKQQGWGVLN